MGGQDTAGKIAIGERGLGEAAFRERKVVIVVRWLGERGFWARKATGSGGRGGERWVSGRRMGRSSTRFK